MVFPMSRPSLLIVVAVVLGALDDLVLELARQVAEVVAVAGDADDEVAVGLGVGLGGAEGLGGDDVEPDRDPGRDAGENTDGVVVQHGVVPGAHVHERFALHHLGRPAGELHHLDAPGHLAAGVGERPAVPFGDRHPAGRGRCRFDQLGGQDYWRLIGGAQSRAGMIDEARATYRDGLSAVGTPLPAEGLRLALALNKLEAEHGDEQAVRTLLEEFTPQAQDFLAGAQEAGAEVEKVYLYDLDLKPCTACMACQACS